MSAVLNILKHQGLIARAALDRGLLREQALEAAARATQLEGPSDDARRAITALGPSLGLAWLENAFATVEPTHRLAASLMCTVLPAVLVEELVLPWRCFVVRVPDGLLGQGALQGTSAVLVLKDKTFSRLQMWNFGARYMSTHGFENGLKGLAEDLVVQKDFEVLHSTVAFEKEALSLSQREAVLLNRLVAGVLVEMATPPLQQEIARGPRFKIGDRRGRRQEPACWVFKLTRPVVVDVRAAVQQYASDTGTGKQLSLQHLVRGHHKRQVCGAEGTERRWIHIEPYWRGPEAAPIALRSHLLKGAE